MSIGRAERGGWRLALAALIVVVSASLAAAAPQGRVRPRDGGEQSGGGAAAPRNPPPAPSPAPPPSPAGPAARPERVPPSSAAPPGGSGGGITGGSGGATSARPRQGGPAAGNAVPRGSALAPAPRSATVFVPGGYYGGFWPWGFGGLGFGGYYDGAFDPYFAGYGPSPYFTGLAEGAMRLKIKPRDAQVYVDGLYVGIVDDFDGIFQRLRLDAGPHHLEVRADGYEPLVLDVQIRPDQTTKYEGDLQKSP